MERPSGRWGRSLSTPRRQGVVRADHREARRTGRRRRGAARRVRRRADLPPRRRAGRPRRARHDAAGRMAAADAAGGRGHARGCRPGQRAAVRADGPLRHRAARGLPGRVLGRCPLRPGPVSGRADAVRRQRRRPVRRRSAARPAGGRADAPGAGRVLRGRTPGPGAQRGDPVASADVGATARAARAHRTAGRPGRTYPDHRRPRPLAVRPDHRYRRRRRGRGPRPRHRSGRRPPGAGRPSSRAARDTLRHMRDVSAPGRRTRPAGRNRPSRSCPSCSAGRRRHVRG